MRFFPPILSLILLSFSAIGLNAASRNAKEENSRRVKAINEVIRTEVLLRLNQIDLDDPAVNDSYMAQWTEEVIQAINAIVKKRFPCDMSMMFSLDLRAKQDLWEEVANKLKDLPEFQLDSEALMREEQAAAAAKFPLYKEGEKVSIAFAIGRAPRRIYTGIFRRVSPYKIKIGSHFLTLSDLPEELRARFDAGLNAQLREAEISKHLLYQQKQIVWEEAIDVRVKEVLEEQFAKNLRFGWVYVAGIWRSPSELVEWAIRRDINPSAIIAARKAELKHNRRKTQNYHPPLSQEDFNKEIYELAQEFEKLTIGNPALEIGKTSKDFLQSILGLAGMLNRQKIDDPTTKEFVSSFVMAAIDWQYANNSFGTASKYGSENSLNNAKDARRSANDYYKKAKVLCPYILEKYKQ